MGAGTAAGPPEYGDGAPGSLLEDAAQKPPSQAAATATTGLAATSRAGQIHIGIDHPIAGQLTSSCILHSGDTAVMTENLMLAAEAEFVFEF